MPEGYATVQLQEKQAQDKSTIETFGGWLAVGGALVSILGAIPFAILASSSGLDLSRPERFRADPASALLILASLLVVGIGLLPFVVGLGMYVLAQSSSPARARRSYGSHRSIIAALIFAIVVTNLLASPIIMFVPLGGGDAGPSVGAIPAPMLAAALVIQDLVLVGVVYLRVVRPKVITWNDMGLTADKLVGKIGAGVVGAIAILAVTIILQTLLQRLGLPEVQQDQLRPFVEGGVVGAVLLVLVTVFLAPIAEEIFFRGYVFRAYSGQKGLLNAFLVSAVLFAVLHVNPQAPFFGAQIIFPVTVMGLILATIVHRTGSVVSTIVAHAINNAVATAALLGWLGEV